MIRIRRDHRQCDKVTYLQPTDMLLMVAANETEQAEHVQDLRNHFPCLQPTAKSQQTWVVAQKIIVSSSAGPLWAKAHLSSTPPHLAKCTITLSQMSSSGLPKNHQKY